MFANNPNLEQLQMLSFEDAEKRIDGFIESLGEDVPEELRYFVEFIKIAENNGDRENKTRFEILLAVQLSETALRESKYMFELNRKKDNSQSLELRKRFNEWHDVKSSLIKGRPVES